MQTKILTFQKAMNCEGTKATIGLMMLDITWTHKEGVTTYIRFKTTGTLHDIWFL